MGARFRPRFVLALCALLPLVAPRDAHAQPSVYYVYDGKSLTRVVGKPRPNAVEEWAAFYFPKGDSKSNPHNRWGLDLKKSPAAVMKAVAANQKFERRYERWCGCPWGRDTFFNEIAPVAMVKKAAAFNPKQVQALRKAHQIWDEVQQLIDRFNKAATLAGDSTVKMPKGPLADYMRAMHKALDQYNSIQNEVTRYSNTTSRKLEQLLDAFEDSQQTASSAAARAFQAPAATPAATTSRLWWKGNRATLYLWGIYTNGRCDLDETNGYIAQGADVNARDDEGRSILSHAQGQLEFYRDYVGRIQSGALDGVISSRETALANTMRGIAECEQVVQSLQAAGARQTAAEQSVSDRRQRAYEEQQRFEAERRRREEEYRIADRKREEENQQRQEALRQYLDQWNAMVRHNGRIGDAGWERDSNRRLAASADSRSTRDYYERLAERAERDLQELYREKAAIDRELSRFCSELRRRGGTCVQ